MAKRSAADGIPQTAEDVQNWLDAAVPDSVAEKPAVLAAAKNMDGPALRALTEAEVGSVLGLTRFGPRRKLFLRIADLKAIPIADDDVELLEDAPAAPAAPAPAAAAADDDVELVPSPAEQAAARDAAAEKARVEDQMNAEASCVGSCRWAGERVAKILREHPGWASAALASARSQELHRLRRDSQALPEMSCVVCGTTGAGKSTLLNALLGESEVLPTNGMRACTAVLIELRHRAAPAGGGRAYSGEAEFLTREEWDKEEAALFEELTNQEGRAILNVADPNAYNHASFCKLYSVYGEAYTHESTYEIRDPATGKKKRVAMTVAELRAKLRRTRCATRFLGTTQKVEADDPRAFRRQLERFMDSSNVVTDGACWPLVRKVRAAGPWDALKSGAVLIDAPGTHDSDSARGAVVQRALKEADSVWIVSNINRAVNDRTAKDLLGESFKRTLLMDGTYGRLVFVATQSDVLQRSEVVRALRLDPETATELDCARARNEYTRGRVLDDFYAGLQDMDRAAGDRPRPRAELEAQFEMPVFCVSSVDYQKHAGLRARDGPPRVFGGDPAATEVPKLVKFVHEASLRMRAVKVESRTRELLAFAEALEALVTAKPADAAEGRLRTAAKAAFDKRAGGLPKILEAKLDDFDTDVFASLEQDVLPRLDAGADAARGACLKTAEGWGASNRAGGLHWATYKATLRRGGAWRTNFNEELAEPVYRAVATHWEKALVDRSKKGLDAMNGSVRTALAKFHDDLADGLLGPGADPALKPLDSARVAAARKAHEATAAAVADGALAAAREHIQKQQKELSREITPMVQESMKPGYDEGFQERGTGSHRRRVAIVEGRVKTQAPTMFKGAIKPVVDGLAGLRKEVKGIIRSKCSQKLVDDLRLNYSVLWEPVDARTMAVRGQMAHPLYVARMEVKGALTRLLDSRDPNRAAAAPADGGDSDDEIQDVTNEVAREKRAAVEVIDVDDMDDDDVAPVAPSKGTGATGVKPERAAN